MSKKIVALGLALALAAIGAASAREIEVIGRVLADGGMGLRGAAIELQPLRTRWQIAQRQLQGDFDPEIVATSRSQRDGSFHIVAPEPGMWRIVVRHPNHLPAVRELKPLLEDRKLPVLALPPREEIDVRVVDAFDEPVAHLRLFAHSQPPTWPGKGWRPETRQAVTAADGRAVLPGHAEETVIVAALGEDRLLYRELKPGTKVVTLRLEAPLADVLLRTAEGQPAPGVVGAIRRPFVAVAISGPRGEMRMPLGKDPHVPLHFTDDQGAYGAARLENRTAETILWLPATVQLAGRVLDTAGRNPIADAWIWTQGSSWQTDHRGAFRARLGKSRDAGFAVAALGYRGEQVSLSSRELAEGERLDVLLAASMILVGRVVDPDGRLLRGAEVEAIPRSEKFLMVGANGDVEMFREPEAAQSDPMSARTDNRGRFRLAGSTPDLDYELRVRLEGYAPRALTVPAVERGEQPERLEIVLEPGAVAVGLVVDGDGQPIAEAEVELRVDSSTPSPGHGHLATTDTAGRFALTDLGQGTFSLVAEAPGFEMITVPGIEIRPGQEVDLGEVVLNSTVTLRGQVTDPQGEALAGARVGVRQHAPPAARSRGHFTAQADRDGSFEIEGMPRTALLRVRVSHDGFQDAMLSEIRADPETPLHIVLQPGIPLRGQVVDPQGSPAVPASVELRRELDGEFFGTATETVEDGRFHLPAQAPGKVTLYARSEQGRSEPLELELRAGHGATGLTLMLRTAAALEGRVVAPDGSAVAGAYLGVERQSSGWIEIGEFSTASGETSGGDGRFRVGGLAPGRYLLSVDHPEFEPLSELVELVDGTAQEVELAFRRRRQHRPISGQVVDPAGEGLSGADVRLLAPGLGSGPVSQASSRRDGTFELAAPRDGSFAIIARHPGFASQQTAFFSVDEAGVEALLVRLEPGGSIAGKVLGLGPEQRRQLAVVAHEPTYGGRLGFVDGGQYRISNLPAGEWRITAQTYSSGAASERVTLGPAEEAVLDLHFESGHRLSGLALRDGEPLAGANLMLLCPGAQFRGRASSDATGWFVVDAVPAVGCTLMLSDPRSGRTQRQELAVAGDAEVVIEISSAAPG